VTGDDPGVTDPTADPAQTDRAAEPRDQHLFGQEPFGGWHWAEWSCEFAGTALLLIGGLSAVCLDFGSHSPTARLVPDHSVRLLITGLLFAGTGSLVAVSPLGRRSGAHLNPVVTLAFWVQHRVHVHDVIGYIAAQCLGALAGAAVVRGLWGSTAVAVRTGATVPGHGFGPGDAVLLEGAMTTALLLMLLFFTSSHALARWTPLGNWLLVATLVWVGADYTGTSLNPARSLGPAIVSSLLGIWWVYVVGPLLGGALATGVFGLFRDRVTLTAKLFHDPRYRSTLGSLLPVRQRGAQA